MRGEGQRMRRGNGKLVLQSEAQGVREVEAEGLEGVVALVVLDMWLVDQAAQQEEAHHKRDGVGRV